MLSAFQAWLCSRIVEESRDAIIFSDQGGIIRLWNTGAAEMFGYPPEEAVGRSLDLIIPENLRDRHNQGYRRVMASGVTRYGKDLLAVPGLKKDGTRISLEFTITLIRDQDGETLGTAAILRDVTARFQREKEMKKRLADLESRVAGLV